MYAIVDKEEWCSGPSYTFHVQGIGESYIDHIVVSLPITPAIQYCRVREDTVENTSDHLAIEVSISVDNLPNKHTDQRPKRVKWEKYTQDQIKERYTSCLDKKLCDCFPDIDEECILQEEEIQVVINTVIELILEVSEPLMSKFQSHAKPYWTQYLTQLCKEEKAIWHEWKAADRPRSGRLNVK